MTTKRAPTGLQDAGRALWAAACTDYEFTAAESAVLEQACIAADRAAQARAEIDRDGVTVEGRYGPRQHPSVAIERDARAALLRALKDLGVVDRREAPVRDLSTPGPKPRIRR